MSLTIYSNKLIKSNKTVEAFELGLHVGRKDRQHIFANMFVSCPGMVCSPHWFQILL